MNNYRSSLLQKADSGIRFFLRNNFELNRFAETACRTNLGAVQLRCETLLKSSQVLINFFILVLLADVYYCETVLYLVVKLYR